MCANIAAKQARGVSCAGGALRVETRNRAVMSYVESNGDVRDHLSEDPVSCDYQRLGATSSGVAATTPQAPGQGVIAGI